jgi:deazaflavin-dependent oxidoreductase (nitroreductase family)
MKDIFIKWFMTFNKFILRISHGRVGSKLGKQNVLILHTLGRKSGQDRAIPIAYFHYEGKYLIVASNWGKEYHAAWYFNLKSDPHASLEIKGKVIPVFAHEALGEEYNLLWKYVSGIYSTYLDYQKMTTRHIPVMVFEPVGE